MLVLGVLFNGTGLAAEEIMLDIHVHFGPKVAISELGIRLVNFHVPRERDVVDLQ